LADAAKANIPLCHSCKMPVLEGEHRWAGHEPDEHWHYSCAETAGLAHARNIIIRDSAD
jgi:hypothetical protein